MLSFSKHHTDQSRTVIFLHGGSYDAHMWDAIIAQMPDFQCIGIDLPGHGKSRDIAFTTIEQAADNVAEIVKSFDFKSEQIHLVGLSLGSYVGVSLLQRHPDLIKKAVLTGFNVTPIPNMFWIQLIGNIFSIFATRRWYRRMTEDKMKIPEESAMRASHKDPAVTAKTIRQLLRAVGNFNLSEAQLQTIKAEILALAGEVEHVFLKKNLNFIERTIANCRSYIIPNLGHSWPAQDEALCVEIIKGWIETSTVPENLKRAD